MNIQSNKMSKNKFFKKKWIRESYDKKLKIKQWEEQSKKAVLHQYRKDLRKMKYPLPNLNKDVSLENQESVITRKSAYSLAKQEYDRQKQEQKRKAEEQVKKQADIKQAMESYKMKKRIKYKKILKKTRKGQPIMKERMEMLLEKIQSNVLK